MDYKNCWHEHIPNSYDDLQNLASFGPVAIEPDSCRVAALPCHVQKTNYCHDYQAAEAIKQSVWRRQVYNANCSLVKAACNVKRFDRFTNSRS